MIQGTLEGRLKPLIVLVCLFMIEGPAFASGFDGLRSKQAIDDGTLSATVRPNFFQLQFALASESDFGPALAFRYERPDMSTLVFAASVGKQLSDSFFRWPAVVVAYAGIQHFGERGFQSDIPGATAYVKVYRQFYLGQHRLPLRMGLGEGLSYVDRIPVVEVADFAPRHSAKLTNYLEWSVQTSLGYLLGHRGRRFSSSVRDVYIGYSIFHRSTAFGLFAGSGGGVNYMGIGIEFVVD